MAFRCHQDNGSHCHDSTQALALLDVIPRSKGLRGRLRCRPDSLLPLARHPQVKSRLMLGGGLAVLRTEA